MSKFDKIRMETHTSMDFAPADKVGFSLRSTDNKGDYNIDRTLDKLLVAAQAGVLHAIPADATTADLQAATYQILGQEDTPETIAAREAGTPVYHVVATYSRVFEYVPGSAGRVGRQEASIAGLPSSAPTDSPFIP